MKKNSSKKVIPHPGMWKRWYGFWVNELTSCTDAKEQSRVTYYGLASIYAGLSKNGWERDYCLKKVRSAENMVVRYVMSGY